MNLIDARLLKCLTAINSEADANLFFDLLARLIRDLDLSEDDERLSLTMPAENGYRFGVNINSKCVLYFYRNAELNYLGFAVYKRDYEVLAESMAGILKADWNFKDEVRPALAFSISVLYFERQHHEELLDFWLMHSRNQLQTQKASQFRNIHIPLVYKMAVDKVMRAQIFTEVASWKESRIQTPQQKFQTLIQNYERLIAIDSNDPERYKWTCVQQFQNVWDVEAADFSAMLKGALSKQSNLLYRNSSSFILRAAEAEPDEVRQMFKYLFKEELTLDVRFALFQGGANVLQKRLNSGSDKNWSHQQDERTLSFYLAMRFPEQYPLYKSSVYKYLQELFPQKIKKSTNQSFSHFMRLGEELLPLIAGNAALKQKVFQTLQPEDWQGPQDWLIFQDVLYRNQYSDFKIDDNILPGNLLNLPEDSALQPPSKMPLNTILYGPPGTGKTYTTLEKAVQCAVPSFLPAGNTDREKRDSYRTQYDALVAEGRIRFVTFHQSFSYEDFIEGIKPVMEERPVLIEDEAQSTSLGYEIRRGIFREICEAARQPAGNNFANAWQYLQRELSDLGEKKKELRTPTGAPFEIALNSKQNLSLYTAGSQKGNGTLTFESVQSQFFGEDVLNQRRGYRLGVIDYLKKSYGLKSGNSAGNTKPYVLIIDEINRGNVSQIFGELITLLEEDKRAGGKEALSVRLPYSGDTFSVPANLYIIGTMNTADRSVEALDTALRRRFAFEEMPPREDLLQGKTVLVAGNPYDLGTLLHTLNERMEVLAGRDHRLGHSFFMPAAGGNWERLKDIFGRHIIPLLQEYFWGDYPRMALVLGSGFVHLQSARKVRFAGVKSLRAADAQAALEEKELGRLADLDLMSEVDFARALAILSNIPETEIAPDDEV